MALHYFRNILGSAYLSLIHLLLYSILHPPAKFPSPPRVSTLIPRTSRAYIGTLSAASLQLFQKVLNRLGRVLCFLCLLPLSASVWIDWFLTRPLSPGFAQHFSTGVFWDHFSLLACLPWNNY